MTRVGSKRGSATELSTVQQFVEERSLAAKDLQTQLHVIWMCLPLDECRELFESEREIFQLLKGTGKEARKKAELEVINRVKELEGELRGLGLIENTTVFLTTSGILITIIVDSWMEMPTVDAERSCEQLINLTEDCLTGPRIKTLLSVGIENQYFAQGCKLGSGTPSMLNMMEYICHGMLESTPRQGFPGKAVPSYGKLRARLPRTTSRHLPPDALRLLDASHPKALRCIYSANCGRGRTLDGLAGGHIRGDIETRLT
ncbi:hypothetical protein B0H14DRAFT_2618591 [Mycena olivaceomarginata]|nr:hypothetical protein B0H14DRAFT_2618591 [Mycena olivaceomarginata]